MRKLFNAIKNYKERFKEAKINTFLFLILITECLFVIVCLCILMARIRSTVLDSLYAQSTGIESPALYGIYKVYRGDPVYVAPSEDPASMVYNYLFYYTYGILARILIQNTENFPVFTHLLTFIATCGYLTILLCYFWAKSKELKCDSLKHHLIRTIIVLMPLLVFFGPFFGWWYLTARSDIMAIGLEMVGLIIFLRYYDKLNILTTIIFTLFFWSAWSMKQATIFVWIGTLLILTAQRKWKQLLISIIFFLLFSSVIFLKFGWAYFQHTVLIPLMIPTSWQTSILVGKEALVTGFYIYVPALVFTISYLTNRIRKNNTINSLLLILFITAMGDILTSKRWACSRNLYFSSFLIAALFTIECIISIWKEKNMRNLQLAIKVMFFSFFFGLLFSSLYLIFPNKFGRIQLLTSLERQESKKIREAIYSSRKPVFVGPAYYALPWNTNQYPSEVVNDAEYCILRGKGIDFALEKKIRERYFAEAFVFDGEWARIFELLGYRRVLQTKDLIHFVR